jgi:hypothetical protein
MPIRPSPSLAFAVALLLPAPVFAQLAGGDDVLIVEDYSSNVDWGDLAMTSDGRLFYANTLGSLGAGDIEIRRSLDGGTTWSLWGTIPRGPSEVLSLVGMRLAEGTVHRLHFMYRAEPESGGGDAVFRHAWASPSAASPTWAVTTPFAEAGVSFRTGDLTSDVFEYGDYYLYAVARASDASGPGDIWFVRSTDKGDSWGAEYRIGDVGADPYYLDPKIAYGGGRVHAAWSLGDGCSGGGCWQNALRYRYATNFAGGIGDWQSLQLLTSLNSGVENNALDIAASVTSNYVHLLYSANVDALLWRSNDAGSTWNVVNRSGFDPDLRPSRMVGNATGSRLWITGVRNDPSSSCDDQPIVIQGAGSPPVFAPAVFFSPPNPDNGLLAPGLAPHPTLEDDYGIAWTISITTCNISAPDPGYFDATWFDDPGYPNLEPGFPVALPAAPAGPPALTQVNGGPNLEIVWNDVQGRIHVTSNTGVETAGWPFDVSYPVVGSAVAVGDIYRNDGQNEVVAGDAKGKIWALDRDGVPLSGFPVDLGTNAPARVTVAPVGAPYPRSIVATSANRVVVLNHEGSIVDSWTVAASIDHAAAVGDIDGDDLPDILVAAQDLVIRLQPGNPTPVWSRDVTLYAISAPVTLADLDLNGTREILVPTVTGLVHAYNAAGTFQWTYDTGTSSTAGAVAAAHILGNPDLEMAVTSSTGVHLLLSSGSSHASYPETTAGGGGGSLTDPVMNGIHWSSSDIVAASSAGEGWAWVNIGGATPGWPKDLGGPAPFAPATGDIDGDGHTEVVVFTNTHLLVMAVNSPPHPVATSRWPMWGNDAGRSFCQGCQAEPLVTDAGTRGGGVTRIWFAPPRPNPSGERTLFSFTLPGRAGVELSVYDLAGRRVRHVLRREFDAGTHEVTFDGRDEGGALLASGVYVARLSVGSGGVHCQESRRLTLIR